MIYKILICLSIIMLGLARSQTPITDAESEIIMLVSDNTIGFPDGRTAGTPSELNIYSSELRQLFASENVEMISQLVPNFKDEDRIKKSRNGDLITLTNWKNFVVIKLPSSDKREAFIDNLKNISNVLHVEPNTYVTPDIEINDDEFERQWYLNNEGTWIQGSGTADADIDALEAWDITTGESFIKIGIVDDGMDTGHLEFSGRVSGDAGDGGPHGTRVAGVAAAKGNNDEGIAGVAWNVGIINEDYGNGSWANTAISVLSAINRGAYVINNSYAITPIGDYSVALHAAFADAYKLNIASVTSMGNRWGRVIQYPAAFGHGVTTVGATTNTDIKANYSSTGDWIDVVAPGGWGYEPVDEKDNIYTTFPDDDYGYDAGTSFSSPIVSGLIALMFSVDIPLIILDHDDADQIIKITADKVSGMSGNNYTEEYGYGRVNAERALKYLLEPYEVKHRSTVGGTINSTTSEYVCSFFGVAGLIDGIPYIVKRHEVRKTVNFEEYPETNVWGRGYLTQGFSTWYPNYGMGYCDDVSFNSTSATLKTYIYQVWELGGGYLGWYPCTASNVYLNYTIHQKTKCLPPENLTYSWSNNHPKLQWQESSDPNLDHYEVWKKKDGSWSLKSTTTNTYYVDGSESKYTGGGNKKYVDYKVRAVDEYDLKSTYTNSVHILVSGYDTQEKIIAQGDLDDPDQIHEYLLYDNYPNPFNPSTTIIFDLPEENYVEIKVYNIQGQIVANLVDNVFEAGRHTIQFDGDNLTSGVYFYKLTAGYFQDIKRMLLIK